MSDESDDVSGFAFAGSVFLECYRYTGGAAQSLGRFFRILVDLVQQKTGIACKVY